MLIIILFYLGFFSLLSSFSCFHIFIYLFLFLFPHLFSHSLTDISFCGTPMTPYSCSFVISVFIQLAPSSRRSITGFHPTRLGASGNIWSLKLRQKATTGVQYLLSPVAYRSYCFSHLTQYFYDCTMRSNENISHSYMHLPVIQEEHIKRCHHLSEE